MTLSSQNNKPKQIILNAFDMNSVGHINHGLWTHPRDESHRFNELSYWTDLAQTLEQGLFDGLFIADITRKQGNITHIRNAPSPGATSSLAIAEYIVREVMSHH